jgi:hypothetical protein
VHRHPRRGQRVVRSPRRRSRASGRMVWWQRTVMRLPLPGNAVGHTPWRWHGLTDGLQEALE